jgi:transposase
VAKLGPAAVLVAPGKSVAAARRALGVSEPTAYRWRAEFGGLKLARVRRRQELERENARLRKAVSDRTLETVRRQAAAAGQC